MPERLPTTDEVRRRMSAQKRTDTKLELELRRALFAAGFRYRVGYRVPGMPRRTIDIAFPGKKVAVFIDGCFWHRCPEHYVPVKNNAEWWEAKLARNVERDAETTAALEESGWRVVRIWEHEEVADALLRLGSILKNEKPTNR